MTRKVKLIMVIILKTQKQRKIKIAKAKINAIF